MTAKRLSFWVGPALYIGVVAGHFADSAPLSILVSAVLALYVALEFRRIAGSQRIAGAVLIGLGAAMALYAGSFVDSMLVGLQRSQSFFLLFSAITWLHIPANHSPSLQAAQEAAMRQAPGWRFAAIRGAAHVLSSVLNMAGISLLSGVVSRQTDAGLRRRLTCALACGFTAASCWTPFYIAVTVVLSVRPDVGWSDLAPMGLVVALALLLLGWIIDRVSRGRTGGAEIQTAGAARAIWDWRAVAIPAGLFGCVVFLVEGRGLPIPIALGVLAPPYAAAWIAVQAHGRIDAVGAIGDLVYRTAKTMPNLRNEVFLFLAANILGTGIAAAIPAESVEAVFGM
ncbi:MAG: hypothetical protein MI741_08045, partial [Rhodospirillales bacterium]|nr:hypothetical protein [Rhodospirillales bacterium]